MKVYWLNEWRKPLNISLIRVDLFMGDHYGEAAFVLFGFGVQVVW